MALLAQAAVEPLDNLVALARAYVLDQHDPFIRSIVVHPELATSKDVARLRERIASFVNFHREHPWRVLPHGALDGSFVVATQRANTTPITVRDEDLARHALIFGGTGSGKTTLVRHLVEQLLAQGVKLVIPDYKDDYRRLAATDDRFLILDEHARFNPLSRPSHLAIPEFVALVVDDVARTFYGGQHLKRYLSRALMQAFAQHERPCIADLVPLIEASVDRHSTYAERDAAHGLLQRLERFSAMYSGMANCRRGIPIDTLFDHSVYLPLRVTSEAGQLLLALIVQHLFQHQRGLQRRGGLEYVLVLDEGMMTWSAHQTNIEEEPILASLMTMVRESGIGMIVTTTTAAVAPILQSNAFLQIALNMTSGDDTTALARTFHMTPEEQAYFTTRLARGECVVKLGDRWRYPILATFAPRRDRKDVTNEEWTAAVRRTNTLAEADPPTTVETAGPLLLSTMVAPNVPESPLLNPSQRAFLSYLCEQGIATVIETYDALHLKAMQGDRIKRRLLALGLLTAHRITVGSTRGKQATALLPTDTAYTMLRTKRPRLGRGSGPQHAWILKALRSRIPHATVEVNGADLAIAYNTLAHARLIAALRATGAIALNDGASIAIEVELAPAKTAARNLDRDRNFALVVLAVPRAHLSSARHIARRHKNAIVVDVFALLDALQEDKS